MGCLASRGHNMIGVDVSKEKVNLINKGQATIVEKDIDRLIAEGYAVGRIHATVDYRKAVLGTDVSFLCVGTPSAENGHLDLTYILQTARQIGESLREKKGFHVVVIRSTVFPGTNERVEKIIAEASGKECNVDFALVSNPEFLREGTAVHDYLNPPQTVIGTHCPKAVEIMKKLYAGVEAPFEVVDVRVAEMIKYVNNSYHALKVVFANEVGSVCKAVGVDAYDVMRLFCNDKQMNISSYYFKPGFAYGGSCLPKDLKGLQTLAHDVSADVPVLDAIDKSNDSLISRVSQMVLDMKQNRIGVLGLSFKAGTDDMRNSPIIQIIETLISHGRNVRIYDKNVSFSRLIGRNKSKISEKFSNFEEMICKSTTDVTSWADVIIVANKDPQFAVIDWCANQLLLDLVRIPELENRPGYMGLWW